MPLKTELRKATGEPRALIVIVHGLKRAVLDHVPRVVSQHVPQADVLIPRYDAPWVSNVDAVQIADEISEAIQVQYDQHERAGGRAYERIILIGHSRGALFVRKAYVFACGQNHELWRSGLRPVSRSWALRVDRIVLLAGMQRGWSLKPKPARMSWRKCLTLRFIDRVAPWLGIGRVMAAIKRGAPFVANLRVQWINLIRSGHPMPLTIQILGDMDDLVTSWDNIDLQAGYNFVYLNAPRGTTHASVVDLSDPAREAVFLKALLTPDQELQSEYVLPDAQRPDTSVEQVVFVVHGIRDFGGWTHRLASLIEEKGRAAQRRVQTETSSYGYFPMLKFLLFAERQKNVRWFMDEYTEALAKYPRARPIDFVGHSNGTYLLASALKHYSASSFGRSVLAGSVLPRNFEWDEMVKHGRIESVRNYVATHDLVVGIFPRLFERFGDIGAAGLLGFVREPAAGDEFHYVKGGHGAALHADNLDRIADYLLDGTPRPAPASMTQQRQPAAVMLVSNLHWVVWLLLVGLLIGIAWWVAFVWSPAWVPYAWLRVLIFIALLAATLNSA